MGWLGWLSRSGRNEDGRLGEWRRAWAAATDSADAAAAAALRASLAAVAADRDDHEIEWEMLEGLDALVELAEAVARNGPPAIATGHRAVGADRCHFAAPASLPDEPGQPGGTFLLTGTRAIFVGGARAMTVPWHGVAAASRQERDVVLVRAGRDDVQRIRCNSYGDALRAAFLARHLAGRSRV